MSTESIDNSVGTGPEGAGGVNDDGTSNMQVATGSRSSVVVEGHVNSLNILFGGGTVEALRNTTNGAISKLLEDPFDYPLMKSTKYIVKKSEDGVTVSTRAGTIDDMRQGLNCAILTECMSADVGGKAVAAVINNTSKTERDSGYITMAMDVNSPIGKRPYDIFVANLTTQTIDGLPAQTRTPGKGSRSIGMALGVVHYNKITGNDAAYDVGGNNWHTLVFTGEDQIQTPNVKHVLTECGLKNSIMCVPNYATIGIDKEGVLKASFARSSADIFPGMLICVSFQRDMTRVRILDPPVCTDNFDLNIFGAKMSVPEALQKLVQDKKNAYLVNFVGNLSMHEYKNEGLLSYLDNSHTMDGHFFVPKTGNNAADLTSICSAAIKFLTESKEHSINCVNVTTEEMGYTPIQESKVIANENSNRGVKRNVVACVVVGEMVLQGNMHVLRCMKKEHEDEGRDNILVETDFPFNSATFGVKTGSKGKGRKDLLFPFKFSNKTDFTPIALNIHSHCEKINKLNYVSVSEDRKPEILHFPERNMGVIREFALYNKAYNPYGNLTAFDKMHQQFMLENKGEKPSGKISISVKLSYGGFSGELEKYCPSIVDHMQEFYVNFFQNDGSCESCVKELSRLNDDMRMKLLPGFFFTFFKHIVPVSSMTLEEYISSAIEYCFDYKHANGTQRLDCCIIAGKAYMDVARLNNAAYFKRRTGAELRDFKGDSLFDHAVTVVDFGKKITERIAAYMNGRHSVLQVADEDVMNLDDVTNITLFSKTLYPDVYGNFNVYMIIVGDKEEVTAVGTKFNVAEKIVSNAIICFIPSAKVSYKWNKISIEEEELDDDEDEREEDEEEGNE